LKVNFLRFSTTSYRR